MSALVEVLDGGLGNSIQDAGRPGYRHMGIASSGFLDPLFARCANALVGNPGGAACLEIRGIGPRLRVGQGPLRLALTGNITASIVRQGGSPQELAAWSTATLDSGDCLTVGPVNGGTAYLALSGGIAVASELGSRSTYLRAAIGGLHGRLPAAGDCLPCARLGQREYREYQAEPWTHDSGPLHVMLGPQATHFSEAALAELLGQPYTVTPESDRMGMRLSGPRLAHRSAAAADIVSDAVTPGAIQVPGNGQPIILLADCQTVGGYPKIATVISADLPRLGQCRPGEELRFAAVDLEKSAEILAAREARWQAWVNGIRPYLPAGYLDEAALYQGNLISGMVRADR